MSFKSINVKDLIWPTLDNQREKKDNGITIDKFTIKDREKISLAYSLAMIYFENEEKRNDAVERKSIVFIGAVGFVITILIAIIKDLEWRVGVGNCINTVVLGLLLVYLCRVGWFSVKALQVGTYSRLGYQDFKDDDADYQKKIIVKLVNYTNKNMEENNKKVDYINMAQKYFIRVIAMVFVYASIIIIGTVYINLDVLKCFI